jgi:predicted transcriptional regulator
LASLKVKEDAMPPRNPQLTDGEWAIIRAVWELQPCAAPTIQEALEKHKGWSYSTVKTMMDRMVTKGLLATERIRNLILYRAVITPAEAQSSEIMRTVRRAFNGALTPMMQFMLGNSELSEQELAALEAIIREKRQDGKRAKPQEG